MKGVITLYSYDGRKINQWTKVYRAYNPQGNPNAVIIENREGEKIAIINGGIVVYEEEKYE